MIGRVAAPAAAKSVASAPVQAIYGAQRGVVYVGGMAGLNQAVLLEAMKYGVRREVVAWAKAHPTIVPYINGDKDMIHSIANTGWTRWIHRTGLAYINTGILVNSEYPFELDCRWMAYDTARGAVLSNYDANNVGVGYELGGGSGCVRHYFQGDRVNTPGLSVRVEHNIHSTYVNGNINSVVDGKTYTASAPQSGVSTKPLLWMTDHRVSTLSAEVKQANQRILANGVEHIYLPYNDGEKVCLLDVTPSGVTILTNANTTGSFTIELTPNQ